MALAKRPFHKYKEPPPDLRQTTATYDHLPLEVVHIVMDFLKQEPKSLARYLSINKGHNSQTNFFNSAWKTHALKLNPYLLYETATRIRALPENNQGNNKLKIAQILAEAKQSELTSELIRQKAPSPGPDAEALEENPSAGSGCGKSKSAGKLCFCIAVPVLAFVAAIGISSDKNFSEKDSTILTVLLTIAGALVGLVPILYPIIRGCWLKHQLNNTEQNLQILQQTFNVEEGERLTLLPVQPR